jgi:hypothetical protein
MIVVELVCTSPEYSALLQAHTDAWMRLRSVKTALRIVSAGLHGYGTQSTMDEPHKVEPLEPRVGFPIDQALVGAWQTAMAQLEVDADVELPSND